MEEGRRVVLFDLRPDSLYSRRRLRLAVRSHGARIADIVELIPVDPNIPMVLYNTDGVRPPAEKDLGMAMIHYGFTSLYWLEGGIEAWVARGYEVDGARVFPRR
jgi:rhodanese-related sulfurtransferase